MVPAKIGRETDNTVVDTIHVAPVAAKKTQIVVSKPVRFNVNELC